MIYQLFKQYPNVVLGIGAFFIFLLTFICTGKLKDKLPADEGRDFAVDGKLSRGKPRGAGIIFISAFTIGSVIFVPFKIEYLVYLLLVFVEMLTGFMDDSSDKPWGRLKKGILDLSVAVVLAFTYVYFNGNTFIIASLKSSFSIPTWIVYLLIIALTWTSINVTNCADGVDGLSGSLVLTTLISFLVADSYLNYMYQFRFLILFFIVAILAYLWFNAGPSILMMGDAGSRAMGMFVSIVALKSRMPLLYIPFAIVLALDGGLGLFKVTVIKLTKKRDFMNKVRTPLHDHVRKNIATTWSNNQVVMRFVIIQAIIAIVTLYIFVR